LNIQSDLFNSHTTNEKIQIADKLLAVFGLGKNPKRWPIPLYFLIIIIEFWIISGIKFLRNHGWFLSRKFQTSYTKIFLDWVLLETSPHLPHSDWKQTRRSFSLIAIATTTMGQIYEFPAKIFFFINRFLIFSYVFIEILIK
jgi:hypothetical protein